METQTREEDGGYHHYVVTEDLHPIMTGWGKERGFAIPHGQWFTRNHILLRRQLEMALNNHDEQVAVLVDSLSYQYIKQGLHDAAYQVYNSKLGVAFGSIISLDEVYTMEFNQSNHKCFNLEVNRVVDTDGKDLARTTRPNTPSLDIQIQEIRNSILSNNVLVLDDGIWSGDTIRWVIKCLNEQNINVVAIAVGVRYKKAGDIDGFGNVSHSNIHEVALYRNYDRLVRDWLCERDYFPGVPYGGRTVADSRFDPALSVGAYYVERPEWLEKWASVDDPDGVFRKFCFERSLALFRKIEELSSKPVLIGDLTRVPLFIAEDGAEPSDNFCEFLEARIQSFA